jgi:Flp pilus assembly protein TadD
VQSKNETRISDIALWVLIIVAPGAGGSSNLIVLPFLVALASIALLDTLRAAGKNRIEANHLVIGLLILATFTALQAAPIPLGALKLLSPVSAEVHHFVAPELTTGTISYEPGATLRQVAHLLVYAVVAFVASQRTQSRRKVSQLCRVVVISGLCVLAIGLVNRVFGQDRILGIVPTMVPSSQLLTTFVNPNHAAGFLAFCSCTALGLSAQERAPAWRVGFLIAALVLSGATILTFSRGGMVSLVGGLVLFVVLERLHGSQSRGNRWMTTAVTAFSCSFLVMALIGSNRIVSEFVNTEAKILGIEEKMAAVRDTIPMIADHPFFGVGRGAFITVYPRYKSSPLQLLFSHPENLIAQTISEWGIFFGLLSVGGLIAAIVFRLALRRSGAALGLMAGVCALTAQNLVDFSLEMPGVAVPVSAALGATSLGLTIRLRTLWMHVAGAIALVALVMVSFGAFNGGDIARDLERFEAAVEHGDSREAGAIAEEVGALHPANPFVNAKLAYLAEIESPPDFARAIRHVNRTLFLAPTYADGHLLAGRVLVRAGHRSQGFTAFREALILSDRPADVISQISQLARAPEEIALAMPRRDGELDILDERMVALVGRQLSSQGRVQWASSLLDRTGPLTSVPSPSLEPLARAAVSAGRYDLLEEVAERMMELDPTNPHAVLHRATALRKRGAHSEAETLLAAAATNDAATNAALLRLRIEIALDRDDLPGAQNALTSLNLVLPETYAHQAEIASLRGRIALRGRRYHEALSAFSHAVRLDPANRAYRSLQDAALQRLGRNPDVGLDPPRSTLQPPAGIDAFSE